MQDNQIMTLDTLSYAMKEMTSNKSWIAIRAKVENDLSKYALKLISLITLLLKKKNNDDNSIEDGNIALDMKYIEGFFGQRGKIVREGILKAVHELELTFYACYDKKKNHIGSYRYIKDHSFNPKTNVLMLQLDMVSAKYLFNIEGGYAKLVWIYTFGMKSKYGQRLYELLVLETFNDNTMILPTEEFKHMMGIKDKYHNLNNLKTKVLDYGVNDVNEFTPFNVSYEVNRKYIKFIISQKSHMDIKKITDSLLNNNQIKDIINSYEYLKQQSEVKITTAEYDNAKEKALEQGTQIIVNTNPQILTTKKIDKIE